MLEKSLDSGIQEVLESAKEVLWIQWTAAGSMASAKRRAAAQIDPEALVLLSLALVEEERRLWDLLAWWAGAGSRLLSVQRMRNLANAYPKEVLGRVQEFAYVARHEGGDFRFGPLAEHPPKLQARPGKLLDGAPELVEAAALLLRLRLGLGVGVKADILGFLLGSGGSWASVKVLAAATDYSVRSVKRAADELARARFVQSTTERPAEYFALVRPWADVLGLSGPPPRWRFWHQVFAFVAHLHHWARSKALESATPYVRSSRARDLIEAHAQAFRWNQIAVPTPGDSVGVEYLGAFAETLRRVAQWMQQSV